MLLHRLVGPQQRTSLLTVCLLVPLLGCAHKAGIVGKWENSTPGNGSLSTMTYNADHTMSFVATNGPKQAKYKLTGQGTWSLAGETLTVIPLSMQLEDVTPAQKAKLKPYLDAQLNVPQAAPVVWKGPNEFVQTKNGIEQNFKRID